MTENIWIVIISSIATLLASLLANYFLNKYQMKRVPSQNLKDDSDAARNALEIAKMATEGQKKLEFEVRELRDRLEGIYRLTAEFDMGDLLKDGKAPILAGHIELVKTKPELVTGQ